MNLIIRLIWINPFPFYCLFRSINRLIELIICLHFDAASHLCWQILAEPVIVNFGISSEKLCCIWVFSKFPFYPRNKLFFIETSCISFTISVIKLKTSQELRMLSSVTINCQITKIVMNSGSQLSEL